HGELHKRILTLEDEKRALQHQLTVRMDFITQQVAEATRKNDSLVQERGRLERQLAQAKQESAQHTTALMAVEAEKRKGQKALEDEVRRSRHVEAELRKALADAGSSASSSSVATQSLLASLAVKDDHIKHMFSVVESLEHKVHQLSV